ncbi:hypothetical protein M408DRAFT_331437 [Serendipita vermifera MAFF 305830]|uniref:Uncharacterized protein n=1 Tax=Serendipita vermifera MAFF 305830 TaxID=933852 RepID=A0A0C3AY84_SERVB|nr:hypothetical protein M408DRAFT_331437 [Serendipita vermifera MAFF 305830]
MIKSVIGWYFTSIHRALRFPDSGAVFSTEPKLAASAWESGRFKTPDIQKYDDNAISMILESSERTLACQNHARHDGRDGPDSPEYRIKLT